MVPLLVIKLSLFQVLREWKVAGRKLLFERLERLGREGELSADQSKPLFLVHHIFFFLQDISSFSRSYNRRLIKQLVDLGEYIELIQQERQRLENR